MKPSFAVVGCGKVGTALGIHLTRAGYRAAGFASKNLSSARQAAEIVTSDHFSDVPWDVTRTADVVFITTPDGAITEACDGISRNRGFADKAVVLHCSGALPSTILSSAKTCGAFTGSVHPLQSFASTDDDTNPFQGIIFSIEGETDAVEAATNIAEDLGGTGVTIRTDAKTLYHASAVVASNYLVTLIGLALNLICEAGIARKDAFGVLRPLIDGTLSNIEKVGHEDALTGPIVRGDVETVKRHIDDIKRKAPQLLDLYKILGMHTIDIARARGTISESCARELRKITAS